MAPPLASTSSPSGDEDLTSLVLAQQREIAALRARMESLGVAACDDEPSVMSVAVLSEKDLSGAAAPSSMRQHSERSGPVGKRDFRRPANRSRPAASVAPTSAGTAGAASSSVEHKKGPEDNDSSLTTLSARLQAEDGAMSDPSQVAALLNKVVPDPAVALSFEALLKGLTTPQDVQNVRNMCCEINPHDWEAIFSSFFSEVVRANEERPEALRTRDAALPLDWFHEPWYYLYVQYTGTANSVDDGDFDSLTNMLPYIADMGFRNLCILPHYQSPMGDCGYDVSAYSTRESLGGEEAFERFMAAVASHGMRVATDAVFNHTSTEHPWFQAALSGDESYLGYYLQRNGREKIAEWDRNGDIVCRYRDPDGTITERVCVFPDVDRTHGLWAEINGKTYQFYREFYPFQVDLNLQNPDVLAELFKVLARELNQGVLGKRMDAIAHWIKKPGTASEGLPESHAVHALFKSFMRHISGRVIVIPEIVRNQETVAEYAGIATTISGVKCPSEGDALLSFEMQAAFREMTYFQTVAPFWQRVFRMPRLPAGGVWVNLLEHHDETFMGFFAPEVRQWLRDYIKSRGGVVNKNGMSAGGRYGDCLDQDPERIATALFSLYMAPGTPLVYAGLEIGIGHNHEHADRSVKKSHETYKQLGVFVPKSACYDPRELQRGPIARDTFLKAAESGTLPYKTVRMLNRLRRTRPSLSAMDVHPIDSGDIGVLCMVRRASPDVPLLCIANLTPFEKQVIMPVWQVLQRLRVEDDGLESGLQMRDVLSGDVTHVKRNHTSFEINMPRFDRKILEIVVANHTA